MIEQVWGLVYEGSTTNDAIYQIKESHLCTFIELTKWLSAHVVISDLLIVKDAIVVNVLGVMYDNTIG